jgi:hypothetical protein
MNPIYDQGKDGNTDIDNHYYSSIEPSINSKVARDAFGFSLGYYSTSSQNDYSAIGSKLNPVSDISQIGDLHTVADASFPALFNGNISYMVTAINEHDGSSFNTSTQLTAYTYDQLNRLASMGTYREFDEDNNIWMNGNISNDNHYNTSYTYDANGNIHNLRRRAFDQAPLDDLLYQYDWIDSGDPSKGKLSNKLLSVEDELGAPINNNDFGDISDYQYDAIGNLISDSGEEIADIEWTVSGKVKRVRRDDGSAKPDLEFTYDPMGNRVMKKVINSSGTTITYYIRDAQGNVLSTYKKLENNDINLQDFTIYGSSRLV